MSDLSERDAAPGFRTMIGESLGAVFQIPRLGRNGVALIVALAFVGWVATSIYKVQPDEQGVVLRFGKWVDTTQPGLHFHWPYPIETALLPKVTQINQIQLGNSAGAAPNDVLAPGLIACTPADFALLGCATAGPLKASWAAATVMAAVPKKRRRSRSIFSDISIVSIVSLPWFDGWKQAWRQEQMHPPVHRSGP